MQDVEAALERGPPERHAAMLARVTNLLLQRGAELRTGQLGAFDEVLSRLAEANGPMERARLADRVADLAHAPAGLVRRLAFDEDLDVASPVLERSPVLGDDDLLALIGARGPEHLAAIARRRSLPEPVTEALIERGDDRVVRATVANPGAALSNKVCGRMVQRAVSDPMLRRALRARPDLPAGQIARLVDVTRTGDAVPEGPGGSPQLVEELVGRLAAAAAEVTHLKGIGVLAGPLAAVSLRARARPLTEWDVAEWLRRNDHASAIAAVATLSRLPARVVARAHRADPTGAFLLVVRALDFSWDTFELALLLHPEGAPPVERLDEAVRRYRQLSSLEARVGLKVAMGG
jgi:uncharacterized protein (DUF2336 family)